MRRLPPGFLPGLLRRTVPAADHRGVDQTRLAVRALRGRVRLPPRRRRKRRPRAGGRERPRPLCPADGGSALADAAGADRAALPVQRARHRPPALSDRSRRRRDDAGQPDALFRGRLATDAGGRFDVRSRSRADGVVPRHPEDQDGPPACVRHHDSGVAARCPPAADDAADARGECDQTWARAAARGRNRERERGSERRRAAGAGLRFRRRLRQVVRRRHWARQHPGPTFRNVRVRGPPDALGERAARRRRDDRSPFRYRRRPLPESHDFVSAKSTDATHRDSVVRACGRERLGHVSPSRDVRTGVVAGRHRPHRQARKDRGHGVAYSAHRNRIGVAHTGHHARGNRAQRLDDGGGDDGEGLGQHRRPERPDELTRGRCAGSVERQSARHRQRLDARPAERTPRRELRVRRRRRRREFDPAFGGRARRDPQGRRLGDLRRRRDRRRRQLHPAQGFPGPRSDGLRRLDRARRRQTSIRRSSPAATAIF